MSKTERAIFFIDGNNFYHSAKNEGVEIRGLDYMKFAKKLSRHRKIVEVIYYIGKVSGDLKRQRDQNKFFSTITNQGVKVTKGRIERKSLPPRKNPIQKEIKSLLDSSGHLIKNPVITNKLNELAEKETHSYTEKRVDVNIAVDMVAKAYRNEFDVAYLMSADGDFVPAVEAVRSMNKIVFAASVSHGVELGKSVNGFIFLGPEHFSQDVFENR